jgi:hypothetical protein
VGIVPLLTVQGLGYVRHESRRFADFGVRSRAGSRAAGVAMAFKLIESAQARWRAVNAPHLVALEPAQDSRTANSSNDPTSQEVKLKSRDTVIHTC